MKKGFLLSLLFVFSTSVFAQNGYQFKGQINGVKDTTCMLAYYYGDKQYAKDTADIDSQGNFVFQGDETLEGGIYMIVFPEGKYAEIIVSEQRFSFSTDITDLVGKMSFKNSTENAVFYGYMQYIANKQKEVQSLENKKEQASSETEKEKVQFELDKINKEVMDYQNSFTNKNKDAFFSKVLLANQEIEIPEPPILANGRADSTFQFRYYKSHFFDKFDFTDERMLRTPIFHSKINSYLENLTVKHPDSIIISCDYLIQQSRPNKDVFQYLVSYLTSNYERSKIMGLEGVFVHMVKTYYKTDQVWWVDEAQMFKIVDRAETIEPLMIGKLSPNLYLRDTTETVRELHAIDADFTIVIFYDPDCGHCKKEMPVIKQHHNDWLKEGIEVEVFAVCVELEKEPWKEFLHTYDIAEWINVGEFRTIVDGEYVRENDPYVTPFPYIKQLYDIIGTPKIYLLDKNKNILVNAIKGNIGVEQIGDIMRKELKNR